MRSMTGFGRSVITTSLGTLTTEIRAVNHRYCQVSLRFPPEFVAFEPRAIGLLKTWAARGQIHANVSFSPNLDVASRHVRVDRTLARRVATEARSLQGLLDISDPLTMGDLFAVPGVIVLESPELDEEERWAMLAKGLSDAWDELAQMREAEGDALSKEMRSRLSEIRSLRATIACSVPDLMSDYREKLTRRIHELTQGVAEIDEARIALEAGLLADRADVSEELVRLESHCDQFAAYLDEDGPTGRQMDFLLQEMNREANTIASKATHATIVSECVRLKTEIERLREQAQNVE